MNSDNAGVRRALDRMEAAWAAGDATAYAECFTPDASYVAFVGTVYRGREEIERAHKALFARFAKGTRVHSTVTHMASYGERTAVVVTYGDASARPPRSRRPKVQTFTFVEADGEWLCAAFQNTKQHRLMERISFLADKGMRPAEDLARR